MKMNLKLVEYELSKKGMTYADLARLIGVHPNTLYTTFKRNSMTLRTLSKVGEALQVDPKLLLE